MRLQAQAPFRMAEDVVDDGLCVLAGTGLEEMPPGFQAAVCGQVLSCVHHFYFVYVREAYGRLFGRTGDPVDAIGQRMRPVCFDADVFPRFVQAVDERLVNPKRRFAARQHHKVGRIGRDGFQNRLVGHECARFVPGVAKTAFQVAP